MVCNSGFTAAALPSICSHIDSTNKTHRSYYTDKQLNGFLLSNMDKFLSSIGIAFNNPEKKMGERVINRYVKKLTRLRGREYLQNCSVVVDSAGFQIQNGYLDKPQIKEFNDLYYNYFLQNNSDLFEKAFVLDIIPGYNFCPYKSWAELEEFNVKSYESAIALPQPILNKMVYIHHFRTPKTYKLYKKLFFDMDYSSKFNNFAVGGLVNFHAKSTPPCIMYVVPLVDIITKAIASKKKSINFHVLGETEWKSVLAHCFIERHIKEVYDIDIKITFDSSTIFKVLAMGRYTFVLDDDAIFKLSIKSDNMYNTWRDYGTAEDAMYKVVNKSLEGSGMQLLDKTDDPMYLGSNSMNNIFYTYGILQIFKLFNEFQTLCNSIVDELYPIYQSGDELFFVEKVSEWMSKFNDGRDTKSIRGRVSNLVNSFDILNNLDRDYTGYLVNRYADSQEYESL